MREFLNEIDHTREDLLEGPERIRIPNASTMGWGVESIWAEKIFRGVNLRLLHGLIDRHNTDPHSP